MKDIDFDELDRAVSSVLGQKPSPTNEEAPLSMPLQASAPTVVADTSGDESKAETVTESAQDTTPVNPTVSPVESSRVITPLAAKRRGKFMDVMHPSADMSSNTPAPTLLSKQPHNINPLAPLSTTNDAAVSPDGQTEATNPADIESPAEAPEAAVPWSLSTTDSLGTETEPTDTASEHADNLPMVIEPVATSAPEDTAPKAEPIPSAYVDPLDMPAPDSDVTSQDDAGEDEVGIAAEASPQSTPFLADTKVDKRPLGAFVESENTTPTDNPSSAESASLTSEASVHTSPASPLPRELQPDVVDAESDRHVDDAQPDVSVPDATTAAATSVAADDDRVEGHPLFDTSTYHEPIAAKKTKSTPAWVWWLLGLSICLAIGAGVGYFLFTTGL